MRDLRKFLHSAEYQSCVIPGIVPMGDDILNIYLCIVYEKKKKKKCIIMKKNMLMNDFR